MSGHLSIMRNPAPTAAMASQGTWVTATKYYGLDAEILGQFIYHIRGVGGHIQMASKISESLFFSALHSSSKFPSPDWLRNTRRIFIPVVLWHLYVKSRQELEKWSSAMICVPIEGKRLKFKRYLEDISFVLSFKFKPK